MEADKDKPVIYIRTVSEVQKALKALAGDENRTISNMAETIIRRYLEERGLLPKEKPPVLMTINALAV